MRDALIVVTIIIFLSVVLGLVYNTMQPYLFKFGILESQEQSAELLSNGGVFRSDDFAQFWDHISEIDEEDKSPGNLSKSDVYDIQFAPNNASTTYAATSAGLFIGDASRGTWFSMTDKVLPAHSSVQSFRIDPSDPSRMYVALTANGRGRIVKRVDGGFYEVYSTLDEQDNVNGVWIDSYEPQVVFAGTKSGLFLKSIDFGESWRIFHEFYGSVENVEMAPNNTRIMYAVIDGSSILKTGNGGESWFDISSFFHARDPNIHIEQIRIDPHDQNRIYVATSVGLFRSQDAGASFAEVSLLAAETAPYVSAVAIDPARPDVLYAGVDSQIYKSEDKGRSWQVKTIETARRISVITVKPDDSNVIYAGVKQ